MNVSYMTGLLVLTLRGSYDQGFLQPGFQINVSYMTGLSPNLTSRGLCLDFDIDPGCFRYIQGS